MHGERNYPEAKIARDWDIGLPAERPTLPVVTFAGGYAQDLCDTVEAHCNTIRTAALLFW